MSTNDVPGAVPANGDTLRMGCWAEADDGSLIFVKSVEGNRVVFEMFDLAETPITQYTDAMNEDEFKTLFSYDPNAKTKRAKGKDVPSTKWTWHDKTRFDWDRVIKSGAKAGQGYASAGDLIDAADKVRRSQTRIVADALGSKMDALIKSDVAHMGSSEKSGSLMDRFSRAVEAGLAEFQRNA